MSVRSAAAVVASFAAFAAGCAGGSDSEQEGWADSVCAPFVEWRAEVRALEEELQEEMRAQPFPSPSGDVLETASDVGSAVSEATEDLLAQLEDVGAPPVEDEQDAADVLGGLSISLEETRDGIEGQVGQLYAEPKGEVAQTIGLAGSEIRRALVQVQETIALIAGMSEQLRRAFADAGSCQELRQES